MTRADHAEVAEWDAAYVLGALSLAERREFEEHLEACARCRAGVAELSGMPGLLGRIDDARAFALLEVPDAGERGLPTDGLVTRVRARDRAQRVARGIRTAAGLVAAAAIAVVLTLVIPPLLGTDPRPGDVGEPAPAVVTELTAASGDVPVQASVRLTPADWGTRIEMDCSYRPVGGADAGYGPAVYAMWVVGRDGAEIALSSWTASPDHSVSVSAGTALGIEDIAGLQVRTGTGDRVLLSADFPPGDDGISG